MRLNRRVPVGTHGGVRGRLSIYESLLLDSCLYILWLCQRRKQPIGIASGNKAADQNACCNNKERRDDPHS